MIPVTATILQKMITYFGTDVRRISHALKVYGFAGCIAQGENCGNVELLVVDIAAILHDIGIKEAERKHASSSSHYQEIEGPPVARNLLNDCDLPTEVIERICFLIGHHHSYQKIDGIDFQILVEADFLVNIHEDGMIINSIASIQKKYFKTKTGSALLENMYTAMLP